MEKSFVLSVSAGPGYYRHIQISESATLYELSSAILDSVEFSDDHLHSFFMNNRAWNQVAQYTCPNEDLDGACDSTDKTKLSRFHLDKGSKFLYIFDYGDEWRFQIKVLRVVNEPTQTPRVLKSVGVISQYGYDEDDEDGEEDF
ncbi:MAG: plasmid pRiA4b ORF-3 family protein [Eubacteriaceae bacterium]|jgi:hypothetical protein|nr:plasmid pRiA4b ORF-3 family protein [Eubacteriaceae bacterium]